MAFLMMASAKIKMAQVAVISLKNVWLEKEIPFYDTLSVDSIY